VAEKTGRVRSVRLRGAGEGEVADGAVLDVSSQVSGELEQGLLGLTFSPDGGRLYVDYTNRDGDTRVVEYGFADGKADTGSAREVLAVDQPFPNHNGGEVAFGPDGLLYVGLGDGGSQGDPNGNGQNLGVLLGKILRLDPRPSGGRPYTVPADNPFVGRPGARPEVWAYGLRNPWRFTWDRATGDLWIGDVGQDKFEEVDFRAAGSPAGANFGWNGAEGNHTFKGGAPPGAVAPLFEYSHDKGISITGGYVYRGQRLTGLQGAYVCGDAASGRLFALVQQGGRLVDQRELDLRVDRQATGGSVRGYGLASFGEDAQGSLYLLSLTGELLRFEPGN
jgi:glucose/arabinose dehydrogenase